MTTNWLPTTAVEATEVFASDRKLDLAIIRVDAAKLRPLKLGDSDQLRQGAQVVAIGNPLGLEHSVVQGVLSARREFEGIEMLQLAIPIEPGNSGGPLLDEAGNLVGIIVAKLNALKVMIATKGEVPQNVNFAIKASVAATFLTSWVIFWTSWCSPIR